jgi:Mg-chelatase subunit ChlI
MQVDGHRADLVILKAGRAHAAFEGRKQLTERDIALAAELALPHRLRRGPFQHVDININELQEQVEQIQTQVDEAELGPSQPEEEIQSDKKKVRAKS